MRFLHRQNKKGFGNLVSCELLFEKSFHFRCGKKRVFLFAGCQIAKNELTLYHSSL